MPALREPALAFFLGSTISNIVLREGETLTQGITRTLTWFADALPPGSKFILSYDSCQRSEAARARLRPSHIRGDGARHRYPHEPGAWP